jgi:hypothetical protein
VKKTAAAFVVLAVFALTACDSGPTQEEKDAAARERTEATKLAKQADAAATLASTCRQQVGGLLKALRNTGSRLDVGMSFADYGSQVGQISVAYDRIPIGQMDLDCTMGAGVKAEKAFNSYNDAYNAWNDCIGDLYCDMDSVDPELQKNWLKADSQTRQARSALADLDADAVQARAEADQQRKKAEEAEAALDG